MNKLIISVCLAFSFSLSAIASSFTMGGDVDARWKAGVDYMYRLEFKKAENEFKELIVSNPGHPAGTLAMAGLLWWQMSQNFDTREKVKEKEADFMAYAEQAIEKSKDLLAQKETPQAYFYLGNSYGIVGQWYAFQRKWWKAYVNGSRARKYLQRAVEMNPEAYDAYFGLGIYNYYTDAVPSVLKIPSLLFLHGDKKRGFEQLKLAIDKGVFFNTEAKLFMMGILIQFEHKYADAIKIAQDLRVSQPDNSFFSLCEVVARFNSHDWLGASYAGEQFLEELKAVQNPELEQQVSLVYLFIGNSYIMTQRYQEALDWFNKAITEPKYHDKGWVTYSYLRRGQVHDLLGEREKAVEDYKTVLGRETYWSAQEQAQKGIRRPYRIDEVLTQIATID